VVTRRIWVDTEAAAYCREALNFCGLRILARVDSEAKRGGQSLSRETRYFACSLDPERVSVWELLRLIRGHWQVENSLHHIKDRWWDEDRHVCRRPGLAERFTTLLSAAVTVLRVLNPGEPDEPLKAQADALNWDIDRAINLLTGRHL
jgi:hypothetical protein